MKIPGNFKKFPGHLFISQRGYRLGSCSGSFGHRPVTDSFRKAQSQHQLEHQVPGVDFPPCVGKGNIALVVVMVVVQPFTDDDQTKQPVVLRMIWSIVVAIAKGSAEPDQEFAEEVVRGDLDGGLAVTNGVDDATQSDVGRRMNRRNDGSIDRTSTYNRSSDAETKAQFRAIQEFLVQPIVVFFFCLHCRDQLPSFGAGVDVLAVQVGIGQLHGV